MQVESKRFKQVAARKMVDPALQQALKKMQVKVIPGRASAVGELGNFEEIREAAKQIRNRALESLDVWLERFEREATARGTTVHWAENAAEANRLVVEIARRHDCRKAAKSKSMVSEETGLNAALEAAGVQVVETDLGEYILQLGNEPPSHIVMPVIHKTKDEISDLFEAKHGTPRKTGVADLCREARERLRPHFLSADLGISGANFLIAETGSVLIVTNEGNGRLCTTLPRVHVAITGIEKVVPTLEDASTLVRLLPRSATGQAITNYVSVLTGPRETEAADGPEHNYVILVDNGRSALLGSEVREMLRCIRCGACMNHCPVYQTVGGHTYGWVYPGPMGSILTPSYVGLENALDLPHASTLCNQCGVVCPVKIPLPDLQRKLRELQVERGLRPLTERLALRAWAWAAGVPALYALGTWFGVRYLKWLAAGEDRIQVMGLAPEWTAGRDFPAPQGRTFREQYRGASV
jgi:L-lactate dehydrogenase complex protein LldF